MNKKLNNIKEAEYYTNFNLIGEHIVKNKKLKRCPTDPFL